MRLYDLLKDKIKDPKGVISDNEMVLLNRRDFLYGETSTAACFLKLFNAEKVTYEMYAIVDFLQSFLCKISSSTEVRIYQLSQSMTLPSLAVSAIAGNMAAGVKVHAPRGFQNISVRDSFAKELLERFNTQSAAGLAMTDLGAPGDIIDVILCNASNEAEVSSALKAFERVRRGFILIKGYGRHKAPNCGEIILAARLNVHSSLAGFAFCAAI